MGKIENKVEIKDLDACLEICKNMAADNSYKLSRAKSPQSKRTAKESLSFWSSTGYYLSILETMADDEFLDFEARLSSKKGGENG